VTRALIVLGGLALCARAAPAQGYRIRLDLGSQAAAFRGVQADSIAPAAVVTHAIGGPMTPDGFAVRCVSGEAVCRFYRPGPVRHGGPVVAAADFAVWGFGVAGLSVRGTARAGADWGNAASWPGTKPSAEVLEGYIEYATGPVTAQAGRRQRLSRLGAVGFDGAQVTDPGSDYFVSERAGLDASLRAPFAPVSVSGGADYDMARGQWGSAEGSVTFADGPIAASVGARRHRPYFDLWTIWGAFSPVPYRAEFASVRVTPVRGLSVSGRGEVYRYDPTEADAPLVEVEPDGWRWSADARVAPGAGLEFSAGARVEFGPGASSRGFDAGISYRRDRFDASVFGMALERPLEFRFDQSQVWAVGAQGSWRPTDRWSAAAGISRYAETRERPDAAAFDWNQVRAFARITVTFGSADRASPLSPLPPARGERRPGGG
jgi:hypothetical protein